MEILNFQANGLQMEILGNGILYVHHVCKWFWQKNKWSAIPRSDLPKVPYAKKMMPAALPEDMQKDPAS